MNKQSIVILLIIIEDFLMQNKKHHLQFFLKDIYLIGNLEINNKQIDAKLDLRSLYISDNSIDIDNSKNYYNKQLNEEFFLLFYKNFDSFFPKKEWQSINSLNDTNSLFYLSKQGEKHLYYDYKDYWLNIDSLNHSKTGNIVFKKKIKLFNNFLHSTDSIINNLDIKEIKSEINKIEERYSINISYYFDDIKANKTTITPSLILEEEINILQLHRYISALNYFLSTYSQKIINNNLKSIFLLGGMRYYHSNNYIGGTFNPNTSSLYLVNIGNSDDYILGTLHHEFSSLLLRKYNDKFPKQEWVNVNDSNFIYKNLSANKDIYKITKTLNEQGFINAYCTTFYENDFNEYAKWYILKREELISLSNKYAKINKKYQIIDNFYKSFW